MSAEAFDKIAAGLREAIAYARGWQPIETAPRDGTKVLLCRALNADGRPMGNAFGIFCQVAAWWSEENHGEGEWVVYCDMPQDPWLHFEPTHWQPLPEPPTT